MYALTKKDTPFVWTDDCQRAFDTLKCLLMEAPLVVFPDFSKNFQRMLQGKGWVLSWPRNKMMGQ